jgi:hypothetical protein
MTTPRTTAPTAQEVLSAFDYERCGRKANE